MDLQKRLAQCRVDMTSLAANEQELLDQIEEKKQKIPFARFVSHTGYGNGGARLILHLTPEFVRLANKHKGRVVALGYYGSGDDIIVCCNTTDSLTVDSLTAQYEDVQTLID